jgi:hypothetical protein
MDSILIAALLRAARELGLETGSLEADLRVACDAEVDAWYARNAG